MQRRIYMSKFYSVRILGRERKIRFKGSRKTVYKKLKKLKYTYNRRLRLWERVLKEIAIYGYVINNNNNYSLAELTFYTSYNISLDEIFKILDSSKLRIIRAGLNNRIDITERNVNNYNGIILRTKTEIEKRIRDYIATLNFIPRQNRGLKHSGSVIKETEAERLRRAFFEK